MTSQRTMGPTLRCYHLPSGRLLAAVDVFDGVRIHGIVQRGSRGVGGAVWTREGGDKGRGEAAAAVVVVHGERRVKMVVLTVQQAAQGAATVRVRQQQQGVGERRGEEEQGGVGQGAGGGVEQGGEGQESGGVRMAVGACVACRDHWVCDAALLPCPVHAHAMQVTVHPDTYDSWRLLLAPTCHAACHRSSFLCLI
ncbi:unnamed protein product [Closterium sp. Yama58-4]|nr:unnamed protein product [Closterium sp. Yama58-4]